MPRTTRLLCLFALFLGLLSVLPALAASYEDLFLANVLVARLRDPGKFASLAERAAKVESLFIEVLSTQDTMHPKVEVKREAGMWVVYSGAIRVLSVLPKDAAGSGMPAKALAQTWANNLKKQLPLATPASRMGPAAPRPPAATPPTATPPTATPPTATPPTATPPTATPPAATPPAATPPAATPPAATPPAATPPAATPPAATSPATSMTRQAALVLLLDALNQARAMREDQYLARREDLANQALAKLQAFMAGQPALVPPPVTPVIPPTAESPTAEPPVAVPTEPVSGLPQVTPLPADIANLPVHQRVVRKFKVAAGPYLALRHSNPALYAQLGTLFTEARRAKAAYKWEDAEGYLDGALAMLGFKL